MELISLKYRQTLKEKHIHQRRANKTIFVLQTKHNDKNNDDEDEVDERHKHYGVLTSPCVSISAASVPKVTSSLLHGGDFRTEDNRETFMIRVWEKSLCRVPSQWCGELSNVAIHRYLLLILTILEVLHTNNVIQHVTIHVSQNSKMTTYNFFTTLHTPCTPIHLFIRSSIRHIYSRLFRISETLRQSPIAIAQLPILRELWLNRNGQILFDSARKSKDAVTP